jgi:hypothetical protein
MICDFRLFLMGDFNPTMWFKKGIFSLKVHRKMELNAM